MSLIKWLNKDKVSDHSNKEVDGNIKRKRNTAVGLEGRDVEASTSGGESQERDSVSEETSKRLRTQKAEKDFDCTVSDFAEIVNTRLFVDKSLMIKYIFCQPDKKVVTVPRHFSKSTNIDMVKRFLEIEVDEEGQPIPIDKTDNYHIFKDNNLEICKDDKFFEQHFGKYPVVHIDFESLNNVNDFYGMLKVFKFIVRKTYGQHMYISEVGHKKQGFGKFLSDFKDNIKTIGLSTKSYELTKRKAPAGAQKNEPVQTDRLAYSLLSLTEILHKYFEKEVFVLIDNYDAFLISALTKVDSTVASKILSFLEMVFASLLKNNASVKQALLMGLLPLNGDGFPFDGSCVDFHWFMRDNCFSKCFGLTLDEIDKVLKKTVDDTAERETVNREIVDYYSGYKVSGTDVQVYSMWSVLQHISTGEVQNFACYKEYISILKPFFKEGYVRKQLAQLLFGKCISVDLSQPLSSTEVLNLKKTPRSGRTSNVPPTVSNNIFLLLYHFGYLSINEGLDKGRFDLRIPNDDYKHELAKLYLDTNEPHHRYQGVFGNILNTVNSFETEENEEREEEKMKRLYELSCRLFDDFPGGEQNFRDTVKDYFISLAAQPGCIKISYCDGLMFPVILFTNKRDIIVCIIYTKRMVVENDVGTNDTKDSFFETILTNDDNYNLLFDKYRDTYYKIMFEVNFAQTPPFYCYRFLKKNIKLKKPLNIQPLLNFELENT